MKLQLLLVPFFRLLRGDLQLGDDAASQHPEADRLPDELLVQGLVQLVQARNRVLADLHDDVPYEGTGLALWASRLRRETRTPLILSRLCAVSARLTRS